MQTDVQDYFSFQRGFKDIGDVKIFETEQLHKLEKELDSLIPNGKIYVIHGEAGVGKSATLVEIQNRLRKQKKFTVCDTLAFETHKITIRSLTDVIFEDIGPDKGFKIPSALEKRERALCTLIQKRGRPIVLFVDDAQDLNSQTLQSLRRMVQNIKKRTKFFLTIVLVGHPRLNYLFSRPHMQNIGHTIENFEFITMNITEKLNYVHWLLNEVKVKSRKQTKVINDDAIKHLIAQVSTPRQITHYLEKAFIEAYQAGDKVISKDIILSILSGNINSIEARLTRLGYNSKMISAIIGINKKESEGFMANRLEPYRMKEIQANLIKEGVLL